MTGDVHLIALGARTPVGLTAASAAAAVRAGISRVGEHPLMVDAEGNPLVCGLDGFLSPADFSLRRWVALLELPLCEVLEQLPRIAPLRQPLKCRLCLPLARPGFPASSGSDLCRALAEHPWPGVQPGWLTFEALSLGHAGVAVAVERALLDLRTQAADVCLVAGAESYLQADSLAWLDSQRRLMRPQIRGGFPPGEAAAALALASDAGLRRLGANSLATIVATAQARESADENSAEGLQGVAMAEVFQRVGSALPDGARFDDVWIDINDERARTTDYAFALLRCGSLFRDASQYVTSVTSTGELGAASGVFNCVLAARAFSRGYSLGEHALVSCASWDGLRGAILLRAPRM